MNHEQLLTVQRLSDLDDWEFYEVIAGGDNENPYTIGLRPYPEFGAVEFELWDGNDDEPWDTGSVPCEEIGSERSSAATETLIQRVIADKE